MPGLWQILNRFYESVLKIFKTKFKGHKTVHAIDITGLYLKQMMRSGNPVSSHSGLILCTKKERDCFGQLGEKIT